MRYGKNKKSLHFVLKKFICNFTYKLENFIPCRDIQGLPFSFDFKIPRYCIGTKGRCLKLLGVFIGFHIRGRDPKLSKPLHRSSY